MWLTIVVSVVFVGLVALVILQPRFEIVPEEERVIIYRLGRFFRIAGPGMVWFFHRFDTLQRRFTVRNEPHDCFIDGLFVYGIPIGLTLNLWYRYDPVTAASGNRVRLVELSQFGESERRSHLVVKLRDALVRQLGSMEQEKPLDAQATIVDKLTLILPGVPSCIEFLRRVQQDLTQSLPSLGIILDTTHSLLITRLHPPEDLIKGFSRDRAAALLRLRFPNLSDSMMVHMLEAIEGLEPLRIHEVRQIGDRGEMGPGLETRWLEDDMMFRMPAGLMLSAPSLGKSISGDVGVSELDATVLGPEDLAVLKRVPRSPRRHKSAA